MGWKDYIIFYYFMLYNWHFWFRDTFSISNTCGKIKRVSHMETVYTFCKQKLYKMYTSDVYKIHTTFWQRFVYILYTKLKELFQLNFVYKMVTKVCQNVGYILYTDVLYTLCIQKFVEMWDAFCIQPFCIYTFCIHFVYKMYTKVCWNMG